MASKLIEPSRTLTLFLLLFISVGSSAAQIERDRSGVGQKEFRRAELNIVDSYQLPRELPAQAAAQASADLADLGLREDGGHLDVRSGRWGTLLLTHQLIPGRGVGNNPVWPDGPPRNDAALKQATWKAFSEFLENRNQQLRVDANELPSLGNVTVKERGNLIQIHGPRVIDGVPVRDSYVMAVINHGNLVLFGAKRWGNINISRRPQLSEDEALAAVEVYLEPYRATSLWGKNHLAIVPLARGHNPREVSVGQGYDYRLVWAIRPSFDGDLRQFEALVDAHSGELISFEDTNHYASEREVKGGVYPVSNDGTFPAASEQAGWPMPFDRVSTEIGPQTTDSGGNLPSAVSGTISSSLNGQYIRISDNCGPINLSSSSYELDFGTSGGTDCTTPGFGGPGNTHASRTGFFELNRISEMARSHLPGNSWLNQQLTANMNIVDTCNAFWDGSTVNFFRSGGGCANTGEIAGVFDHEWGHGIDDNDSNPSVSNPGEGIADIYAYLRLRSSCIGQGFAPADDTCFGGYGDPCIDCTGIRDIDYLMRASQAPHDVAWIDAICPATFPTAGPCGGAVHCEGAVYSEAVYDLANRKLTAAPYNMDSNTAHEVVTRLTFAGATNVGNWFQCTSPWGGCNADGGYLNYLAADDDNGNLNDGTPHMSAIFSAFNDHGIACNNLPVQDSGCPRIPTTPPTLSSSGSDKSADLSWNAVAGATSYQIFRTDTDGDTLGLYCDFGKIKVGETASTSFSDSGLQNQRWYSYIVVPIGGSDSCMGPASNCSTVRPSAGPNLAVDTSSASLSVLTGDGDAALDNCEQGLMTFNVTNTGLGALTNVRIASVSAASHPGTTILTSFPQPVGPSTLAEETVGTGSFEFVGGGLGHNETLVFQVEVMADELTTSKSYDLPIEFVETDLTFIPSITWDFETGLEGWTTLQGTFNQASPGGSDGSSGYVASSAGLGNQCDQIRSPAVTLSSTSTVSMQISFEIEGYHWLFGWHDRANVGVYEVSTGNRWAVTPDDGYLYVTGPGPGGTCGTQGQDGWAETTDDTQINWYETSWSPNALGSDSLAGKSIQLDIRYGTDDFEHGKGFWFDKVTVTDVVTVGPDTFPDGCSTGCTVDADCDDGLYCSGVETCVAGTCQAGAPVVCNDGVSCTDDSCNEGTNSCDNLPDDSNCNDSLFCTGVESCDAVNDCQAGTPVDCNDGVGCTDDACNEVSDSCDNIANDANCDNGLFCDGAEACDESLDCQTGTSPCSGQGCDEGSDVCTGGLGCGDGICEAGEDCNNCPNDCISGTFPGAACGNGVCEAGDGEDCISCPADCNGVQTGKPSGRFCCGDGDGTNPLSCDDAQCSTGGLSCTDDPQPGGAYCCGDLICDAAEDSLNCEVDCGAAPFCGDGTCDPGEDPCSCATDCGSAPASEAGMCTDGSDNDCDDFIDCADTDDCGSDTACQICTLGQKGDDCLIDSDCCSDSCKRNGTCK